MFYNFFMGGVVLYVNAKIPPYKDSTQGGTLRRIISHSLKPIYAWQLHLRIGGRYDIDKRHFTYIDLRTKSVATKRLEMYCIRHSYFSS